MIANLKVLNIDTEKPEKNSEEGGSKLFRNHRMSHATPEEIFPLTKLEIPYEIRDLVSSITIQSSPSIRVPNSVSTVYESQSLWYEQNCPLTKIKSTLSGLANDLTEKDIEDIAYSSEPNSQVKFGKNVSRIISTDEVSCRAKKIILADSRKEEDTKYGEGDLRSKRDSFEDHQKAVQVHPTDLESNLKDEINQNQSRQSGSANNSRGPEIILGNDDNTNSMVLSQNSTPVEGVNNRSEQVETSEEYSNIQEESLPEIRIYMSKAIALFLSSILFLFWSILAIENNWEFVGIFGVTGVYPIMYVLIDLYWTYRLLKDLWIENGDHFKMFDASSFLFALLIIFLRLMKVIGMSTGASILFFLTALAYLFHPKKKVSLILSRWFYTLQCLLITLKLDQHLNFKWEIVLIPIWIYFACLIATCTRSLFDLMKRSSFMNSAQNRNITPTQKCGMIWFSCYYGLSVVYLIYLFGAVQALNSGAYAQLLRVMSYLALGFNVIFSIYTLQKAEKLVVFISCYQIIESHLARVSAQDLTPTKVISLQRELKTSYFVKVSATYFKPLHNHFLPRGQYLRAGISRSKANFSYSHHPLKSDMFEMNDSKQGKEELDHKINSIKLDELNGKIIRSELLCNGIINRSRSFSVDNHTKSKQLNKKQNDKEEHTTTIKIKEFIQEEYDKDELKMLSGPDSTPRGGEGTGEEEKTCYLCYQNSADAILISCGHGGICYECALSLVKKKNECVQCRGKVEAIYKIDPNPILDDIIKGVELIKVVLSE